MGIQGISVNKTNHVTPWIVILIIPWIVLSTFWTTQAWGIFNLYWNSIHYASSGFGLWANNLWVQISKLVKFTENSMAVHSLSDIPVGQIYPKHELPQPQFEL